MSLLENRLSRTYVLSLLSELEDHVDGPSGFEDEDKLGSSDVCEMPIAAL